jgi:hypothetical protein
MVEFVWLLAREAGWRAVPINPAAVAYLLDGPEREKRPTTRVVFGHMIGALAELNVEGEPAEIARRLAEGAPNAGGPGASRSHGPPRPSHRPAQ